MATMPIPGYGQAPGVAGYGYQAQQRPGQAPQGYGYTAGPAGSSGGLGNRSFYEQQTPAGSFVAAEQQYARPASPAQQQYATNPSAANPYIGQSSGGIAGASSVLPYGQQIAGAGQQANPYLGATTQPVQQTGPNQFMGRNPYLEQSIQSAQRQAGQSFADTVLPQFDRMDQASGSFGNVGIQQARERAMGEFGRSQADAATRAYMQDYGASQQLAENALNRQQQINMTNAGLSQADIARNLGGAFQGQQIGMQGLSALLGAAGTDAGNQLAAQTTNAGINLSNLGRNSQLMQQLGMFNAGQSADTSRFNAGQGNQMGQFNAQLAQQLGMFNAGQGNALGQFNAGQGNSMLERYRDRTQQQGQFDASRGDRRYEFDSNLDWGIDRDNWNRMRTGQQDQLGMLGQLLGWNQGGIGNAQTYQDIPLQQLQLFSQIAQGLGGMGGQSVTPLNGNPLLGALGGWQLMQQLFGGN